MKLKNNRGVTGIDVAISIFILIIFVSIIVGLFSNLSYTSKQIERKTTATNLAIEIIEALKVTNFSDLVSTEEDQMTISELNSFTSKNIIVPNGYKTKILIDNYNNEDVIKILKVEVTYESNKQEETVEIETLVKNL